MGETAALRGGISPNPPNQSDTAAERRCWGERARLSGLPAPEQDGRSGAARMSKVSLSIQSPTFVGLLFMNAFAMDWNDTIPLMSCCLGFAWAATTN